ncbi:NUDIX domain-containing protein [Facklamia sp. 7083-14-GEN3]|uniref:NUDIX domain-containing protein n=1 Tax=Facklamia sp. 7083-14-GEN3 TaxID=2973478 RepID=UPI00215B8E6F|nr:NUDIX domain-containing protein [Facklamia sp. 7083-14-GEN3]MCR8969025.1 NUDIX domain-containing protein [Facklamia sp. 7083-14-GEN3]
MQQINAAEILNRAEELIKVSPFFNQQKFLRIQEIINQYPESNLLDRKSSLHLSASALVFQDQSLVFIRHPYLHKTLLPAGHVEIGETTQTTALRELYEETGLKFDSLTRSELVDLNLFAIPANSQKAEGSHYHIDFRYYFQGFTKKSAQSELAVHLLEEDQAPAEFKPYFQLIKKKS